MFLWHNVNFFHYRWVPFNPNMNSLKKDASVLAAFRHDTHTPRGGGLGTCK